MTRNLFIFAGIISLLFGLPLIFKPDFLTGMFLVDSNLTAGVVATFRDYGILLSSVGIGLLIARNAEPGSARSGWLVTIIIGTPLAVINTVYAIVQGVANNNAWIIAILCAIEAIWGIIIVTKKASE